MWTMSTASLCENPTYSHWPPIVFGGAVVVVVLGRGTPQIPAPNGYTHKVARPTMVRAENTGPCELSKAW
jgi:hypothetical protein